MKDINAMEKFQSKVDCNPRFPFCNRLSHFVSGLQNLYPKFHFCNTIPVPRDDFVL